MKALLATAAEDHAIRHNPAAGLRNLTPQTDEPDQVRAKALSEDELRRLLDELPEAWRLFFEFLAEMGLRIGEAIEVRHGDVGGGALVVQRRFYQGKVALPKGRKTRRVPLSAEMARRLWALRKETQPWPRNS